MDTLIQHIDQSCRFCTLNVYMIAAQSSLRREQKGKARSSETHALLTQTVDPKCTATNGTITHCLSDTEKNNRKRAMMVQNRSPWSRLGKHIDDLHGLAFLNACPEQVCSFLYDTPLRITL